MGAAYLKVPAGPLPSMERKRGCTGKVGYALEQANRTIKDWAPKGKVLFRYQCKHCNKWHLTKEKQK